MRNVSNANNTVQVLQRGAPRREDRRDNKSANSADERRDHYPTECDDDENSANEEAHNKTQTRAQKISHRRKQLTNNGERRIKQAQ